MHETLVLDGCAPTPLVSYLKALGILRLISSLDNNVTGEAADPKARGWWENERFYLRTMLTRDAVLGFFLNEYAPSPIIAPWNGRAGFLEGEEQETSRRTGADLMRRFEESQARRFVNMRRTIERSRSNDDLVECNRLRARKKALNNKVKTLQGEEKRFWDEKEKAAAKKEKQLKKTLLPLLRSTTELNHVLYVDACYVLSVEETPMPLLGSGGNDGSRDFGVNFAEALTQLFAMDDGSPVDSETSLLDSALFGGGCLRRSGTMGRFSPGQGGSNATTGYEGSNPLNPWDIVLAMEGTIVFAGALTRRWGEAGDGRAAFPFTFDAIGAGAGNFSSEDPNRPRHEIWTPLWNKPATFLEIGAVFSEGRLTLGHRTARTGLDAARSVAGIGLARGISSFERYSIIQPDSKMPYQATPLGRIATPNHSRRDLIADLEQGDWLGQARRLASNKKTAPSRARHAMRRLEDSLFQMTDARQVSDGTRNALMSIGVFVNWMVSNRKICEELNPPPVLSPHWIRQADDGTPEFRIAAALASLGLPSPGYSGELASASQPSASETNIAFATHDESVDDASVDSVSSLLPMAAHFAPIDEEHFFKGANLRRNRTWASAITPTAVWGNGSLVSNMIAVLERRIVEASMRGLPDKPLDGATSARAADVSAFLEEDFDDARCAALLAGLIWAKSTWSRDHVPRDATPTRQLPFAYAALKPIFSTNAALRRIEAIDGTARLPLPQGLLTRLRSAGDCLNGQATDEAVRAAFNRARASGLVSPFDPAQLHGLPSSRIGAGMRADRLAASLLIPIRNRALKKLLVRAYPNNDTHTQETNNAA